MPTYQFRTINERGELIDLDEPIVTPTAAELMAPPYDDVDLSKDNPWGLPDWRDPCAYAFLEHASTREWDWEFVRRTEEYRSLWLEMQELRGKTNEPLTIFNSSFEERSLSLVKTILLGPHYDSRNDEIYASLVDHTAQWIEARTFPPRAFDNEMLHEWLSHVEKSGHILARIDPFGDLPPPT